MNNFVLTEESFNDPQIGKLTKKGKKVVAEFRIKVPIGTFDSMEDAKTYFSKHSVVIKRIVTKYFDFIARTKNGTLIDNSNIIGAPIVKAVLQKMGFIA